MPTLANTLQRFQFPAPDVIARSAAAAKEEEKRLKSDQRRRRYSQARIPERYRDAELSQCTPDVQRWVQDALNGSSRDLVLIGLPGRGKTYAACAAAHEILNHTRCLYASQEDMLGEVKATFDTYGETKHAATAAFTLPEFLVIDDLGESKPTDWNIVTLFKIIKRRHDQKRPTIYTTMYAGDDLAKRLTCPEESMKAQAILSRLREAKIISFTGEDRRCHV